jgi:hypothetical protein
MQKTRPFLPIVDQPERAAQFRVSLSAGRRSSEPCTVVIPALKRRVGGQPIAILANRGADTDCVPALAGTTMNGMVFCRTEANAEVWSKPTLCLLQSQNDHRGESQCPLTANPYQWMTAHSR